MEILVLAVGAGLLGTWIVLRGLAFYTHAVAAGTFPGLVLAAGLSFAAPLGATAAAALFAVGLGRLAAREQGGYDSATALALVAALSTGVILASDVFHSGSEVEGLLFGSLLAVGSGDILLASGVSLLAIAATLTLGPRWLTTGFDRESAATLGVRPALTDLALLSLVALAAVATLSAIGALLASAVLVVPAATTRLWAGRLRSWQLATVGLVAGEGTVGLWLSVELNVPPGAAIAVLAGAVFAFAAVVRSLAMGRSVAAVTVGALLCALAVSGCGSGGSGGGRMEVVATTTQIGDLVRMVGGREVRVHQILKPNSDPHEYEPRPDDVAATAEARIVFVNGDGLDRWMDKVVDRAGGSPRVVRLADAAVVRLPGESSGPEASKYDPHWWHDPINAQAAVWAIRDALARADPAGRSRYEANAARYVAQLQRLDAGIRACLARVPSAERKLVTSHDAFNYFARRYGVKIVGAIIPSQTTQAQPSAGAVAALADQVRREHVKAVFLESSVNPKLAKGVARETGAIGDQALYGDTLGPKGSDGDTYLEMEVHNMDAILHGLSGGTADCGIAL
ncbi:MAG: zinc ABC transporter substrate-binding protein [Actinomycetota bacterium]|nr:zinc ABC transporter substrate-binding protein [Actinomycetota bacterium]